MYLKSLILNNFRNYSQQQFKFSQTTTVIVGANTAGKTNLAEAIMLLSTGRSFKAEKDFEMIAFDKEVGRVQGLIENTDAVKLEVVIAQGEPAGGRFAKKYLVNGVAKSKANFVGFLPGVLFRPEELDIIIDGPSLRRAFLNDVLESVDKDYIRAKTTYEKALRQRNALLDVVREGGIGDAKQFEYWDNLLITNGQILTNKREEFINFINLSSKSVFDLKLEYDKSIISRERLDQYRQAEIGAGNTLVGPQRDDFIVYMKDLKNQKRNVQHFGSRGQQRLAILQLKLLHIAYVEEKLGEKPLLILDDIFSELDNSHIELVLEKVRQRQIVITTTHKEFIENAKLQNFSMVELNGQ